MYNTICQNKLPLRHADHLDFSTNRRQDTIKLKTKRSAVILSKVPTSIDVTPKPQLKNRINIAKAIERVLL